MKYEPQPDRSPRPQRSTLNCSSSNSFAYYSFRTLASHLKATVSSNSFEINRFRTLCKIPGIGYPPLASRYRSTISSTSPKPLSSFNSFTFNGLRTLVAQWSAATPVYSDACGLFPLQWGCIPPLYFPLLHCAFCCPEPGREVRKNCFLPDRSGGARCHTLAPKEFTGCVFHGGRGVVWFSKPEVLHILAHYPLSASVPARSFVFGVEGSGRLLWIGGGVADCRSLVGIAARAAGNSTRKTAPPSWRL
jgi:hypothetical protein